MLKFDTKIEDIDLLGKEKHAPNEDNQEIISVASVNLKYSIEFETRSYGIKDTYVHIEDYSFCIQQDDDYNYDTGETIKGFEIEVTKENSGLEIEVSTDNFCAGSMCISECVIDYTDNVIYFS